MLAGAVKATETVASPRVAVPIVGAPGNVAGVTLFEGDDSLLSPTAFVARTVQVTAVPFGIATEIAGVEPVFVKGPPVPVHVAV